MGYPGTVPSPRLSISGGDLSTCEVTLLNQLNERRDSTSSTLSSAYTLSRRSSGISPCYSSRRSSEASQFGGGGGGSILGNSRHHNNISAASYDSYDPISTDLSRRSSEASQCGGLNGGGGSGGMGGGSLLSLTPAQHYRLKAKYAAATGGAPPTPLPNMERMSLRTRMALYGDSQDAGGSAGGQFHPSSGVGMAGVSRRCSDTGYGGPGMMPHEVPNSLPRRASDPVRRPTQDPLSLPRVQRYNSVSTMNTTRLTGAVGDRRYAFHASLTSGNTWSDGSLHRHSFNQRPPSISENVVMETMALDQADDDMVLPDDVVQYLRTQNGTSTQDAPAGNYPAGGQSQDFQNNLPAQPQQQQQFYGQRRMAMLDASMTAPANGQAMVSSQLSPRPQQQFPASPGLSKNSMPVQWNEVSSGTVDSMERVPKQAQHQQPQQQVLRSNLAVVQQRQMFGGYHHHHHPHQGLQGSNQQIVHMSQNLATMQQQQQQQGYAMQRGSQQLQLQQNRLPSSSATPYQGVSSNSKLMSPEQSCAQDMSLQTSSALSGSTANQHGLYANAPLLNGRVMTTAQQNPDAPQQQQQQYRSYANGTGQQTFAVPSSQMAAQNGNRAPMQPRPPVEPRPSGRQQHAGPNSIQPNGFLQSDYETSEASPKRTGNRAHQNGNGGNSGGSRNNHANGGAGGGTFYSGEIHMLDSSVAFDAPMSPCTSQDPGATNMAAMASPGVNQVTSTVDSQPAMSDHAQIDFDAMLDDGDHSSLMSGTLSPGLLQSLSQNSSRLNTPRNSVTLASVPSGISNMAIGDMTSMLTALAEESKFLNMMA